MVKSYEVTEAQDWAIRLLGIKEVNEKSKDPEKAKKEEFLKELLDENKAHSYYNIKNEEEITQVSTTFACPKCHCEKNDGKGFIIGLPRKNKKVPILCTTCGKMWLMDYKTDISYENPILI